MRSVLCGIFSFCLAACLLAAGLVVDAAPFTTRALSQANSDFDRSPYLPDTLVELAVATRDFTVDPYWQGEQAASQSLAEKVVAAAEISSAGGSQKAGRWIGVQLPPAGAGSALERMYALAEQDASYGLDRDAMSHLVDCNTLINRAFVVFGALLVVGVGAAVALRRDERLLGAGLVGGPLLLLGCMALCGIWAAVDFYGFFSFFHSMLFPQGNWTFSAQSLLICMLPQGFWVGMGAIWLLVTSAACIVCLLSGRRLRK